jgi:hypothetical protein
MNRQLFATAFGAAVLLFAALPTLAQTCTCSGTEKSRFHGGDSKPLTWRFVAKLLQSGTADAPPLICYERSVVNKSKIEVRNVRWEVANYYHYIIPANSPREVCQPLPGEMKKVPVSGLLFHDSTSEGYDTTVRQPLNGWPSQRKEAENITHKKNLPRLEANFIVDLPGVGKNANIYFASTADLKSEDTSFDYLLKNSGTTDVFIAADLPIAMSKEVPIAQKGFPIKAGKAVQFKTSLKGRPKANPATLVVYASGVGIVAIETVALYLPTYLDVPGSLAKASWQTLNKPK